ncbi:MAG: hypothetical protein J0647_08820 [Campylobacteraceae bacterium]|nr:hypothetical protein [Campylobacteraceae bacterium]
MKLLLIFLILCFTLLFGSEEDTITKDIENTQNIEALIAKMQQSPTQYRARYIDAIKEKIAQQNKEKRDFFTQKLIDKINTQKLAEDEQSIHMETLTGNGNHRGGGGGGSNGSGNGNGGGGGGGKGGGGGGGKK